MQIILSFDVEVWCNGWGRLDEEFPRAFERYVYGDSRVSGGALPRTLDTLARHKIRGVFFIEPLFAARFGIAYLREIVDLIASRGHQIELHLHSEWADEIRSRPLPHIPDKRQHLRQLAFEDQLTLIRLGRELLTQAGAPPVRAFRAGSFGANAETLRAVSAAGLSVDCSVNAAASSMSADIADCVDIFQPDRFDELLTVPMTVFRDGFGKLRPAQVGACSVRELNQVFVTAESGNWPAVMLLSHNFEMLRPNSTRIDPVVASRFERLCRVIAERSHAGQFSGDLFARIQPPLHPLPLPQVKRLATLLRIGQQAVRRVFPG